MGKTGISEIKHFHCYATANDSRFFIRDLINLKKIKNTDSGVNQVFMYIAISKVKKTNQLDQIFVKIIKNMFRNHNSIKLISVFFKTNIGRDFSSYHLMLDKVKSIAEDKDYIFFQNRSGYGPFRKNWYKQFLLHFEKYGNTALCGSTINFMGHPDRIASNAIPHVQTYSFISKLSYMNMLGETFPGSNETDRLDIITKGEIGLSQFFLEKNYNITCIEWPDKAITNKSKPHIKTDIKTDVKANHFFYHRKYFKIKLVSVIKSILLYKILFSPEKKIF